MHSSTTALPAFSGPPSPRPLSPGSILLRIALLVFVAFAALGTLAVWTFWPRADTRAVREAVLAGLPGHCETRIQLRLGGPVIGLAQVAASFAPMPDEARQALAAVDSAEVCVAEIRGPDTKSARGAAFARARETMQARGWETAVLVNDGGTAVAVFTRESGVFGGKLRLCTVVFDHGQLVIANAEIDPAPLAGLVGKALAEARR